MNRALWEQEFQEQSLDKYKWSDLVKEVLTFAQKNTKQLINLIGQFNYEKQKRRLQEKEHQMYQEVLQTI